MGKAKIMGGGAPFSVKNGECVQRYALDEPIKANTFVETVSAKDYTIPFPTALEPTSSSVVGQELVGMYFITENLALVFSKECLSDTSYPTYHFYVSAILKNDDGTFTCGSKVEIYSYQYSSGSSYQTFLVAGIFKISDTEMIAGFQGLKEVYSLKVNPTDLSVSATKLELFDKYSSFTYEYLALGRKGNSNQFCVSYSYKTSYDEDFVAVVFTYSNGEVVKKSTAYGETTVAPLIYQVLWLTNTSFAFLTYDTVYHFSVNEDGTNASFVARYDLGSTVAKKTSFAEAWSIVDTALVIVSDKIYLLNPSTLVTITSFSIDLTGTQMWADYGNEAEKYLIKGDSAYKVTIENNTVSVQLALTYTSHSAVSYSKQPVYIPTFSIYCAYIGSVPNTLSLRLDTFERMLQGIVKPSSNTISGISGNTLTDEKAGKVWLLKEGE